MKSRLERRPKPGGQPETPEGAEADHRLEMAGASVSSVFQRRLHNPQAWSIMEGDFSWCENTYGWASPVESTPSRQVFARSSRQTLKQIG